MSYSCGKIGDNMVKKLTSKAVYQSKQLSLRVTSYMYNVLVDVAKDNNVSISDVIRSTLNDRFMQSQKTKRKN